MAWSPDGSLLAIGNRTGIYIYSTQTWQVLQEVLFDKADRVSMGMLAFSPDGKEMLFTWINYNEEYILNQYNLAASNRN